MNATSNSASLTARLIAGLFNIGDVVDTGDDFCLVYGIARFSMGVLVKYPNNSYKVLRGEELERVVRIAVEAKGEKLTPRQSLLKLTAVSPSRWQREADDRLLAELMIDEFQAWVPGLWL